MPQKSAVFLTVRLITPGQPWRRRTGAACHDLAAIAVVEGDHDRVGGQGRPRLPVVGDSWTSRRESRAGRASRSGRRRRSGDVELRVGGVGRRVGDDVVHEDRDRIRGRGGRLHGFVGAGLFRAGGVAVAGRRSLGSLPADARDARDDDDARTSAATTNHVAWAIVTSHRGPAATRASAGSLDPVCGSCKASRFHVGPARLRLDRGRCDAACSPSRSSPSSSPLPRRRSRGTLWPGVTYDTGVQFTSHGPVAINILTGPRPGGTTTLAPVLSNETLTGTETLTAMRAPRSRRRRRRPGSTATTSRSRRASRAAC